VRLAGAKPGVAGNHRIKLFELLNRCRIATKITALKSPHQFVGALYFTIQIATTSPACDGVARRALRRWAHRAPPAKQKIPASETHLRRGRLMTMPVRKARGRPFKPGNPGRPPGSKNKVTQIVEQLAEGQAEQVMQKVLEQALGGDVASQRMILDRVCPPRKGQPVNVVMPPINTSQDLLAAIASIWTAVGEGRLTPDEASALSIVVDRTVQAIELHDITKRIAALEEARDKRDEKNHPPPA
jgi:hypothetical protein